VEAGKTIVARFKAGASGFLTRANAAGEGAVQAAAAAVSATSNLERAQAELIWREGLRAPKSWSREGRCPRKEWDARIAVQHQNARRAAQVRVACASSTLEQTRAL